MNPLWNLSEQRPERFTYGHFPLYLGILTGNILVYLAPLAETVSVPEQYVGMMQRATDACNGIAIAGRLTIALLDTLTILLLFLLGSRMVSQRGSNGANAPYRSPFSGVLVGLLAAAMYAFTAQAVQLSHFFAMDPASTTFTVLAVLGAVMMVQDRSRSSAILCGLGVGMAVASKFSAIPIVLAPITAAILLLWRAAVQNNSDTQSQRSQSQGYTQFSAIWLSLVALTVAAISFLITSPYAVLDLESFLQATLVEQGRMVRGIADMPFTRQYRNTMPYLYFIEQQVRWGLGTPLGTIAIIGTLWMLLEMLGSLFVLVGRTLFGEQTDRSDEGSPSPSHWLGDAQMANIVVWSWVVPYFGLTGAFLAKFNRYMSPVLPFVLLFAAVMIGRIWMWGRQTSNASFARVLIGRGVATVLALVAIGSGIFWSAAYVNGVYNTDHPWLIASRWVYENVPRDSLILWELWDDPLPKTVPNEPGMDMGSAGLRNIDWSPYEEDTPEKYALMKEKLREADYVIYSSKRIYESVDELPRRYPMTIRYYDAMFNEELGFELALDVSTPPALFDWVFEDRTADESWSLYDHPQVTIFRKVRDLSNEEYDAIFQIDWETIVPWDRGEGSRLDPLLQIIGLSSKPESEKSGLINRVIGLLTEETAPAPTEIDEDRPDLLLEDELSDLPVVASYRWNRRASESVPLSVGWWWLVVALLGWAAWPICFAIFRPLRDRGYLLSRSMGWLFAGWFLWMIVSQGWALNSSANAWLVLALLAVIGGGCTIWQWSEIRRFMRRNWGLLLASEVLFAVAFLFFVYIRLGNPDLWQPWFGGEKFMEFAFLNGILRSPTFPPVNPHFAGGYINYYYFGIYLVTYLIKLSGIYAEVAFNLAIPTLFAMTVVNAFAVAYSAIERLSQRPQIRERATIERSAFSTQSEAHLEVKGTVHESVENEAIDLEKSEQIEQPTAELATSITILDDFTEDSDSSPTIRLPVLHWRRGFVPALLAPIFVVLIGNLDGFAELMRKLATMSVLQFESSLPLVQSTVHAASGLQQIVTQDLNLPRYDFWAPSRVIPDTINEFPYWSFLFADLHPHLIGIPFAALFLALVLTLLSDYSRNWGRSLRRGFVLLLIFGLLLGTLASVNLWELPTYFGLGVLALLISQYRAYGRVHWLLTILLSILFLAVAYFTYLPFFASYVSPVVGGIGLVRKPDSVSSWMLVWGFFYFVMFSWIAWSAGQPTHPVRWSGGSPRDATGLERWLSLAIRKFGRLPRVFYLHRLLVDQPSFGYLLGQALIPITIGFSVLLWWLEYQVLALCILPLGMAFLLLWRRGRAADPGNLLVALFTATGFAILAGIQIFYLKDHLQGGDAYRMNTLFKFFSQVWVLWGIAAGIALPRIWSDLMGQRRRVQPYAVPTSRSSRVLRTVWATALILVLVPSFAFLIFGTADRIDMRFQGWRPEFGTLNGLEYMRQGVYTWPDASHPIELAHDWAAIRWLLENVHGNAVIVESAHVGYYRAGGTRAASMTGLSGLRGMHESEQRYGDQVGRRDGLHREFWDTPSWDRTREIIDELNISLIYVGQLERYQHPDGVQKIEGMATDGLLLPVYENERVTIYVVAQKLAGAMQ
ncbi:glycosyltransferase family 39 protein [Chloroflexi bacterium TSY]|nr:glycosyltransferase family 39 protein [Chloroflexi bacterium TSY]